MKGEIAIPILAWKVLVHHIVFQYKPADAVDYGIVVQVDLVVAVCQG